MRTADIIKHGGKTYFLYWQTAMDGKTWCRVKVRDERGREYQYHLYFKTNKAARLHILAGGNEK